jgi:thioredoxin reductase (NADPH)
MESLFAFLLASAVTFFFVHRYLKSLQASRTAGPVVVRPQPAAGSTECPRCSKMMAKDAAFCPGCGASMALWNVHRAAIQTDAPAGEKGAPRPIINASLCIGCGSCVDSCPETGTLELIGGKAILAHADRCKGHAKCTEVCPTSAITLAFGTVLQTLRVPLVKETFETNVSGVYIVGELSGMGLIKTAINEGRMAIDSIKRQMEADGGWTPPVLSHGQATPARVPAGGEPYDVIVVGAGPAGLSASLAAQQQGLNYLTLEQGEIAATIRNYPRHKFLMAEPTEMPLYGTLYIGDGTKESLLHVWEAIVANTGVRVRTNERVESLVRTGSLFAVSTSSGEYKTRNVVLAIGKRGSPRRLGVPGEDKAKVAYGLIEADTYNGRDILVVGGGDSAIEAALALSKAGKNRVTLSYRGAGFDRARERNRAAILKAEQDGRIRILRNSRVQEIEETMVLLEVDGVVTEMPNEFVFVLIGGESPENFLRKIGIEIVEKALSA